MLVSDRFTTLEINDRSHRSCAFPTPILRRLEQLLPKGLKNTAETGCGKSTILFSNLSDHHTVFCLDDQDQPDSSVSYFKSCAETQHARIELIFGPTQLTLPQYKSFRTYDAVLIDGPHAFPFPEIEFYYFYPHIRQGGILILDDVHIPTVGRLGDFIAEDSMFELVELISSTAVFRRTDAPVFNPIGDGWWTQAFNRRRIPSNKESLTPFQLADGKFHEPFAEKFAAILLNQTRSLYENVWRWLRMKTALAGRHLK